MKISRKALIVPCLAGILFSEGVFAQPKGNQPPVAGIATGVVGITVDEVTLVARGWSIKKEVLGHYVYNDKGEKLGKIEDVIASPEKGISYAIVGAGGFLGLGRHDVAIPTSQLKFENDKFILSGATKDVLKAMPKFEYTK
jgi:sporulation protein YlmC with PRC-barrel domain